MRWGVAVGVFALVLVVGAAAIFAAGRLADNAGPSPPPPAPAEATRLPPPPVGAEWRYTAPRAASASEAGVEACARSTAAVPIGGGGASGVMLCLRRGGGYPYAASILLDDPQARFVCGDCAVRAKFDGARAQSFDGTAASTDGSGYTLFIRDGARLAGELKRATTATFVVSIQGVGERQVTFNVAGLRWS